MNYVSFWKRYLDKPRLLQFRWQSKLNKMMRMIKNVFKLAFENYKWKRQKAKDTRRKKRKNVRHPHPQIVHHPHRQVLHPPPLPHRDLRRTHRQNRKDLIVIIAHQQVRKRNKLNDVMNDRLVAIVEKKIVMNEIIVHRNHPNAKSIVSLFVTWLYLVIQFLVVKCMCVSVWIWNKETEEKSMFFSSSWFICRYASMRKQYQLFSFHFIDKRS